MSSVRYSRRGFLKAAGLFTAGLAFGGLKPLAAGASNDRPNIVLIMADDLGYSDIGCYGGEINTPNINRLAENGLRFTQFYNTARCCPTRASLLTGLYQHQTGVGHMMSDRGFDGYRGDLNKRCVTVATVLRQGGYSTYMAGKWHVTRYSGLWHGDLDLSSNHNWPLQRGFDRFYGTIAGVGQFYNPVTLTRDNTFIEPEKDYYYTDAISDNAVKFINEHTVTKKDKPFFCYVAYTAPHWPIHALPEDIAKYKGRYDAGWDAIRAERYKRMVELGVIKPGWNLSERDGQVARWEDAKYKHWHKAVMEAYAAMVDRMDQGIGRIIETLKNTGQLENTLLIFLSDNGGCAEGGDYFETEGRKSGLARVPNKTRDGRDIEFGHYARVMPGPDDTFQEYGRPWSNVSNTPFREHKHWVHEGGISTPFIAHWPKVIKQKGKLTEQVGHVIDIMATCCDVAGAKYPSSYQSREIPPLEGKSLLPIFEGKKRAGHKAIFWEHEGNSAVRKGKWKLVRKFGGDWELYDIEKDRTELKNAAGNNADIAKELMLLYDRWAKRCGVQPWSEILKVEDTNKRKADWIYKGEHSATK